VKSYPLPPNGKSDLNVRKLLQIKETVRDVVVKILIGKPLD
jgi:hypothetical protein